jgi:AsmA-like protein
MSARRRWRWAVFGALCVSLLVAGALPLVFRLPYSADTLRKRIVETLADRLDAQVDLAHLELDVLRMRIAGSGLVIRHRGRTDVPPLIAIDTFTVRANPRGLWNRHVASVKLDGLKIQIPPNDTEGDLKGRRGGPHLSSQQVVLDLLEASDAKLVILRRDPAKPPRTWMIHALRVTSVSASSAMPFAATLTNAVPPGSIETMGAFGPWHRDDPGHTPIDGEFYFHHADLSVFNGISGILSSRGVYTGSLEKIDVKGETDVPDFTVNVSGQPVPLRAKYRALVDGTSGTTTLERIDATFLNTSLVAKGGVYEVEGVKGREVRLDLTMEKARLEDVMRLSVKTVKPPMRGALRLQTNFVLPPGNSDVIEKLRLDGRFSIDNGRFTDAEVQDKINEMSLRASGRFRAAPKLPATSGHATSTAAPPVVSDFQGRFQLGRGVLVLQTLVFDIPSAAVRLNGRYLLRSETLDFRGDLLMDGKVSETVTGWKSWLLKIADPLFRKHGRTVVPIKVTGTRNKPSFGIEVGRVF